MSEVVRVLIADDHPVVRSGIRGMLASDPGFEIVSRHTLQDHLKSVFAKIGVNSRRELVARFGTSASAT